MTLYRTVDETKMWHYCKMCRREFNNEGKPLDLDHNGKIICPECSEIHWTGCGGF